MSLATQDAAIHDKAVAEGALAMLRHLQQQIKLGATPWELLVICAREIRELENLRRTGERVPENTLAVSRD